MNVYRTDNKSETELTSRAAKLRLLAEELAHYYDIEEIAAAVSQVETEKPGEHSSVPDWVEIDYAKDGMFLMKCLEEVA